MSKESAGKEKQLLSLLMLDYRFVYQTFLLQRESLHYLIDFLPIRCVERTKVMMVVLSLRLEHRQESHQEKQRGS